MHRLGSGSLFGFDLNPNKYLQTILSISSSFYPSLIFLAGGEMATTFQHACSVPLARALVRSRAIPVSALTLSTPSRNSLSDSRVLLGLSEEELRQLATGLGQVNPLESDIQKK